jgi:hypothetical protein
MSTPEIVAKRRAAATWLAEQGFAIVHIPQGRKQPSGGLAWQKRAVTDPGMAGALIRSERDQFGALPQKGSRLLVIDQDVADKLAELGVAIPPTLRVRTSVKNPATGWRGQHVYLRLAAGIAESDVPSTWDGGEVRHAGSGQVVGPWSVHPSGLIYEPVDGVWVIGIATRELVDALRASKARKNGPEDRATGPDDPGWYIEHGRHEHLINKGRWLRGHGLTGDRLRDELVRLDRDRHRPPIADLPDRGIEEIEGIVKWVMDPRNAIGDDPPGVRLITTDRDTAATAYPGAPGPLAELPRILDAFADQVEVAGLAGERRLAKLIYLVVTSRVLDRVVSIAVKGPSSAGKSFVVERVLAYFPPSAYYALSAMSEHALVYDEEPLHHRMLVIYEAAGMAGDLATYMMRSLLSEGHVRYVTVEKAKGGKLQPRLIDREGPTGLIVTTTQVKLHPENETRLLSLTVTDSADQTRAVLLAQAGEAAAPDTDGWHDLQSWLAGQANRVAVPYATALAAAIPPVAVRLRRDFPAVLALVRAHAVLHQASRRLDPGGRIVATLEDYAVVRELVADLVAEAAEQTVPETVRETVSAVASLVAMGGETSIVRVAERLKLDKSAALRRARVATERGYLRNLEEKRGRPARLVLGDALPKEQVVLPEVEWLQGCSEVAGDSEQPPAAGTKKSWLQPEIGTLFPIPLNGAATVQPPAPAHGSPTGLYRTCHGCGEPIRDLADGFLDEPNLTFWHRVHWEAARASA